MESYNNATVTETCRDNFWELQNKLILRKSYLLHPACQWDTQACTLNTGKYIDQEKKKKF
jgi:hypothetical protein